MTYTIYYGTLPNGIDKIGVDSNYPARAKVQRLTDYSKMEEHNNIDIASAREIELQIQYFGKRDNSLTYKEHVELLEKHRVVFNSETGRSAGLKVDNDKRGRWSDGNQAERGRVKSTWMHKLTLDQVREIRAKYIPRKYSIDKLAKEYGVGYTCIQRIINNITYTQA
jgi:hypothetical protein